MLFLLCIGPVWKLLSGLLCPADHTPSDMVAAVRTEMSSRLDSTQRVTVLTILCMAKRYAIPTTAKLRHLLSFALHRQGPPDCLQRLDTSSYV